MTTLMLCYAVAGILLILLAIPLYFKKIKPNGLYGFRVKKTRENPETWYLVNRYHAVWLMLTGFLTTLGAVGLFFVPNLTGDQYALICLSVFVGPMIIGLIMTVRYMKSL